MLAEDIKNQVHHLVFTTLIFGGHLPTYIDRFLSHRLFKARARSTLSNAYKYELGVPQGSIFIPVPFGLKVNNITKSVLKGSEVSLFLDDSALCTHAKSLPHIQRLMQLRANSVQDWASKNELKCALAKQFVCTFVTNVNSMPNLLSFWTKTKPIKVVTEAKFLGVVFDRTFFLFFFSYKNHVNYLKTNYLKVLAVL